MIQASFSINPPAPAMHQLFFFLLRLLDSIARVRAENRTSKRKKGKKKKIEITKKKKKTTIQKPFRNLKLWLQIKGKKGKKRKRGRKKKKEKKRIPKPEKRKKVKAEKGKKNLKLLGRNEAN